MENEPIDAKTVAVVLGGIIISMILTHMGILHPSDPADDMETRSEHSRY